MKQESIKRLLAAGLFGCFIASSAGLHADAHLDAFVDEDGNLVVGDTVIPPPEGQVDAEGNLVIGGQTITKPDATVDAETGDLILADGTRLQVPDVPGDPDGFEAFFEDLFVSLDDGWVWSYNFKEAYPYPGTNFVYLRRTGSIFYISYSTGHFSNGAWMYGFDFPTAGDRTWVYTSNNQMPDLRIGGGSTSAKQMGGYLYLYNDGGDSSEWVYYAEGSELNRAYIFDIETGDFTQVWPR